MEMQHPKAYLEQMRQLPFSLELAAAAVANLCRTDPEIASQVRANPLEYIRQMLGDKGREAFPEGFAIQVHENRDDTWHLPLPPANARQPATLSEVEMEGISGGVVDPLALTVVIILLSTIGVSLGAGAAIGGAVGIIESKKK